MSFTVESLTTPHTSGNNWIDSLLYTSDSDDSDVPGYTLNHLAVSQSHVTYTFDSLPISANKARLENVSIGDITFFNSTQRSNAILAIAYVSQITGIEFREVSNEAANLFFLQGDVTGDFTAYFGWDLKYWYDPQSDQITNLEHSSFILMDNNEWKGLNQTLAPGTSGYEDLLHELGHFFGLAHPFEGTQLISPFKDITTNTLMSYTDEAGTPYQTEFSPYDKAALAYIYGYDGLAGEYGIDTDRRIVLSVDGATVVVGGDFHDTIIGTDGNEALYGNGGDDILDGGWGSNEYYGGEGVDTAKLVLKSSDYAVSKNPNTGDILLTYENGDAAGSISPDVEKIEFVDGVLLSSDNISYTGIFTGIPESAVNPVYRFYNTEKKAFFYTSSEAERDYVLANSSNSKPDSEEWPYVYQGATFEADFGNAPLYRFYNTETGHHFFTVSEEERDFVLSKSNSGEWPFNYEGIAFNVYTESYSFTTPVHRFYNPSLNRHFFTANESEAQDIRLIGEWNYEGIGFYGGDFYSAPNPFLIT